MACFSSDGNSDAGNLNALMRVLCQYIVTISVTSYQRRGRKSILTFTKIPFHTQCRWITKNKVHFCASIHGRTHHEFHFHGRRKFGIASEAPRCNCNKSIAEAECVFYAYLTRIITYHQLGWNLTHRRLSEPEIFHCVDSLFCRLNPWTMKEEFVLQLLSTIIQLR